MPKVTIEGGQDTIHLKRVDVIVRRTFPRYHRRSTRLQGFDYSSPGCYFITICTKNGECFFGEIVNGKMILNEAGMVVAKCWNEIPKHYPKVILHPFVIMPNHIHGILEIKQTEEEQAIKILPSEKLCSSIPHAWNSYVGVQNIEPLQDGHVHGESGDDHIQLISGPQNLCRMIPHAWNAYVGVQYFEPLQEDHVHGESEDGHVHGEWDDVQIQRRSGPQNLCTIIPHAWVSYVGVQNIEPLQDDHVHGESCDGHIHGKRDNNHIQMRLGPQNLCRMIPHAWNSYLGAQYFEPLQDGHVHGESCYDHFHGELERNMPKSKRSKNEYQHIIPGSIGSIIRGFEIGVTKWFRRNTDIHVVWQRNFYDRIIRSSRAFRNISNYIINNPRNWNKDDFNKRK